MCTTFASGSHSCRRRPFFGLLFFGPFFALALFCAFYLYIRRRRREDRFQTKIRHLARSQSHTTTTHTHHHHLVDALLLKRQLNSPRKKDAEGCVVCAERRPPPQKKSDVGRARKRHPRDISISTNSSDAFFCCPVGLKKSAADDAAKIDRQREEERLA